MEDEYTAKEGKQQQKQVLRVLEALKQASHELQSNPNPPRPDSPESNSSPAIKALLELDADGADSILSADPHLSALSHHLSNLKALIHNFQTSLSRHGGLRSFLKRRVSSHEISRVAGSIESEIQSWIDRETIENLTQALNRYRSLSLLLPDEEEALIDTNNQLRIRLQQGFNRDLQDLILRSKVLKELESVVSGTKWSKRVRESAAFAIAELIKFNKDVFVGQVLMGETIRALVSLGSSSSLRVLCLLVKTIKSPLVDELESGGGIAKIIGFLNSDDVSLRVMTLDCLLEIGYFGRKEAVEAMMGAGLIKKLVELQRSKLGGDLIDVGKSDAAETEENQGKEVGCGDDGGVGGGAENSGGEMRYMQRHPFASCVARFAVQLEVGEGLRQREKRAFKQEILKKVREATVTDADAATIIAEVLWGSSP